jgi:hypothetical protein
MSVLHQHFVRMKEYLRRIEERLEVVPTALKAILLVHRLRLL